MRFKGQDFSNWSEYFQWLFSTDGRIKAPKTETKNQATIETYTFKDANRLTEIVVTYIENYSRLIHYEIIEPVTVGYTAYQRKSCQYFEQGHFADPPEYGDPGLVFDLRNLTGIDEELNAGLDGQEVQYLSEGKVMKSKIVRPGFSDYTYRFDGKGLLKRFGEKLSGIDEEQGMTIRTINLKDIFDGIKK